MGKPSTIRALTLATLIAVYLVILAGSVVRMTGSGMGCPDWPECFGQWIPPTDVSQLPSDYEEAYLAQRKTKLDKYIRLIEGIGLPDIARQMRQDPSLLESEPFDARGTWIEYVNRLFGFLSGNLMLLLVIASMWWWRRNAFIPMIAFVALITIGFQAWLGSVVVATNLLPWTITIHMIGAFIIVALLVAIHHRIPTQVESWRMEYRWLLGIAMVLTLVQVVLGTQVRQEVDELARQAVDRGDWIDMLSLRFELHRSFSIVLLLVSGSFLYLNRQSMQQRVLQCIAGLLLAEVLAGIVLAYFALPHWAQPTHLLLATLLFGAQSWAFFHRTQSTDLRRF